MKCVMLKAIFILNTNISKVMPEVNFIPKIN